MICAFRTGSLASSNTTPVIARLRTQPKDKLFRWSICRQYNRRGELLMLVISRAHKPTRIRRQPPRSRRRHRHRKAAMRIAVRTIVRPGRELGDSRQTHLPSPAPRPVTQLDISAVRHCISLHTIHHHTRNLIRAHQNAVALTSRSALRSEPAPNQYHRTRMPRRDPGLEPPPPPPPSDPHTSTNKPLTASPPSPAQHPDSP